MKSFLAISLFLFLSLRVSAQINFEKGYFVSNFGERTEGLIKNVDWKNNPTSFTFRVSQDSEPLTKTSKEISEFGVGEYTFVKSKVNLNRSSDLASKLDRNREIKYQEEELLLSQLVKGSANLYYFEDGNLRRFFFSKEAENPVPLGYKRFRNMDFSIGENKHFQQQLWNELKCDKITRSSINKTSYKKEALISLFIEYNQCSSSDWIPPKTKKNKDYFNFSIRPGLNFSSLTVNRLEREVNYKASTDFRFGLELEFILPFNKNKWGLLFEPTYRNYQSTTTQILSFSPDFRTLDTDYPSIEFSIGIRYYSFLTRKSKLFFSGYLLNDMELGASMVALTLSNSRLKINPLSNAAVGLGYKLTDKFSAELRYDFNRELIRLIPYTSDFKNVSIILGYTLF